MKLKELLSDKVFIISNFLSIARVFFMLPFGFFYLEGITGIERYNFKWISLQLHCVL